MMLARAKVVFLLIVVVLDFPPTLRGQSENRVIRVHTDLTVVSACVYDRDGRFIGGLDQSNFNLLENGVQQKIEFFESVDEPFTALLLFDTSGSVRDYMPEVVRAANTFVSQLRSEDRIAVAFFTDDTKIHILLEPTKRKDFDQVVDIEANGRDSSYTTTFDAVKKALKFLEPIKGKKALVLFSDGEQFGRHASAKSNLRNAEEQEAVIYTLQFGEYPQADPDFSRVVVDQFQIVPPNGSTKGASRKEIEKLIARVDRYMKGLAERTGGRAYKVNSINDLSSTFRTIAAELGTTYRLGYSPTDTPKDGEKRTISVKVDVPNAAVRSRKEVVYKSAAR